MVQFITILICVVSICWSFFSATWAWLPIGILDAFLLYAFLGAKQVKVNSVPELSSLANQLLRQYGHFYVMPFASRDYSSSASTIQLSSIIIAIVGLFKGFWWALGIGALNYFLMGAVSAYLNPIHFLRDPHQIKAHEEIISYFMHKKDLKDFQ